jgi:acetyltransferase
MALHYLRHLIEPLSIAVFGASERPDSVGARVYKNLISSGFTGSVHGVNPKYQRLSDRPCYAKVTDINQAVDLAVIATPAPTVPQILHECGEHGVSAALILSAGFREGQGQALLETSLQAARRYQIRLLGPNCLGVMRPRVGLNATFSNNIAHAGHLALVSQSGALCTAILDWAQVNQVGFSLIASIGDAADVGFGDLLDFLAMDPHTKSILLYVEGVRNARSFMSGLRAAARLKPVVVVKSGRHAAGSRAAVTHTGALVGGDDVFDAALRRAGVVRATTIEQLFAAAELLSTHQRVQGDRLVVITNGGGPGVMAVDRAADLGIKMAEMSLMTLTRLDELLPPDWSHANPVDILGDATPPRYGDVVGACMDDPGVDGVLVMLTPQAMTQPEAAARAVIAARGVGDKPVLACWMGEDQVAGGRELFVQHKIPVFPNPEAAVEAFAYLCNHQHNQKLLMQVPGPLAAHSEPDIAGSRLIIEAALAEHRTLLTGEESRALLRAFHIPVVEAVTARSAAAALVAAETVGFPVVLKINSPEIDHKSDVGGVRLDVRDAVSVRRVYNELTASIRQRYPDKHVDGVTVSPMVRGPYGRELLVGVITDPVFGPVISFGAGGTTVEIVRDRAVALPPFNSFIARDLIQNTRVSRLLAAFRNLPPADVEAVERVLLRVSEMVCELEQIEELDINPLIVDENAAVAVDVRIAVRFRPSLPRRYAHMAIHPYPADLVSHWQLADGTDLQIRPIRPEDAALEQSFVRNLSPQSKYLRFMHSLTELTPEMLVRLTQIDYDREMGFVGLVRCDGAEQEIGVARYITNPDAESCEFAIVVADEWQHKGIGSRLMGVLIETARQRGFKRMGGEILTENLGMQQLVRELGFELSPHPDAPGIQVAVKDLQA